MAPKLIVADVSAFATPIRKQMTRKKITTRLAVLAVGIALGAFLNSNEAAEASPKEEQLKIVRIPQVFNTTTVKTKEECDFPIYGLVVDETVTVNETPTDEEESRRANRELSRVRFGMSRDEVSRIAPTASRWADGAYASSNGSRLSMQFDGPQNTLSGFTVSFPSQGSSLQSSISQRFGPGVPFQGRTIWNQPDTGVRTEFQPQGDGGEITLTPYVSIEQFVDPEEGTIGSEDIPTIGSTKEELIATYAPNVFEDGDELVILTPPIEFSSVPTESIVFFDENGLASGFTISSSVDLDVDQNGTTLLAGLLEDRFGDPVDFSDNTESFLSEENSIDLASTGDLLSISVGVI